MDTYKIGFLCGFLAVFLIIAAIQIRKRKKGGSGQFDERQMVGRGKAFQAGFFTLLMLECLNSIGFYLKFLPGDRFLWDIGVFGISITIFAVTAICNDAYLSMTESPKNLYLSGGLLFGANLVCFFINISDSGHRSSAMINGMLCLMWAIIVLTQYIHSRNTRKELEE